MEVILLKSVERLGKVGDKVLVKEGYARNFLLPKGLAVKATAAVEGQMEARRRAEARRAEAEKAKAIQIQAALESLSLVVPMAVGDQGRLHGAVTSGDLAEALKGKGILLEKHQIELKEPIAKLGTFEVPVKLHSEVTVLLKGQIVRKK